MSETAKELDSFFSTLIGTLQSPGKGRKYCGNEKCDAVVGARTQICECGYSFLDGSLGNKVKPKEVHVVKTFDGPGQGRTQCTSCKKYVGARSIECPVCGVKIEKGKNKKKAVYQAEKVDDTNNVATVISPELSFVLAVGMNGHCKTVYAPSGSCPFELKTCQESEVYEWCDSILNLGLKQGAVYLPQAIKYWLRFQFAIGTKEYEESSVIIDKWTNELQGSNEVSENS